MYEVSFDSDVIKAAWWAREFMMVIFRELTSVEEEGICVTSAWQSCH